MNIKRIISYVVFVAMAPLLHSAIEFTGVLVTPEGTKFALSDSGQSAWVIIGQKFEGYSVSNFESATETIVLTKDAEVRRIPLKNARITTARYDVEGSITLGNKQSVRVVHASLNFDKETIFPLDGGMTLRLKPTRREDGNILYDAVFEKPASDGKREIVSSPKIISKPDKAFGLRVAEISFDFKPITH